MAEGTRDAGGLAPAQEGKLKVFISYSRDDLDFADQLAAGLELCGFNTTIDRHEITGGEAWRQRLGAMIRDADTIAFVLSPASAASKICAWEVDEAAKNNKRILPIVCAPLGDVSAPPQLHDLNYIFFYREPDAPGSGFGTGLTQTASALNTDVDWVREHTRLLARAGEWEKGGRPGNRLLSGADIIDAKTWAARRPKDAPALTALHLDFIRASEDEEASRANAERARLDEMAAAQDARAKALREAEEALQQAAEAQRARNRQRMYITWGSLASGLIFAVVAGFAVVKRNEAKTQEARAIELQELAEGNLKLAEANLEMAQIGQSNAILGLAENFADGGDQTARLLLALEALPDKDSPSRTDWPFVRDAKKTLDEALRNLREHATLLGSAAFSPDGKLVITRSESMSPRIRDTATRAELRALGDTEQPVSSAVFSPDGSRVITTSQNKAPTLWDVATGKTLFSLGAPEQQTNARISPDGSYIVTITEAKAPELWDAATGGRIGALAIPEEGRTSPTFNRDGKRLLTITTTYAKRSGAGDRPQPIDRIVRLWDAATGQNLQEMKSRNEQKIGGARFSPDGKFVLINFGLIVHVYDAATGQERFVNSDIGDVFDLVILSPDGAAMVTTSVDGKIRLWDTSKEAEPRVLEGHEQALSTAAFSPDGKLLLTASDDKTVVRQSDTGAVLYELELPVDEPAVVRASFSADSSMLLTTSTGKSSRLWNAATGKSLRTLGKSETPDASFSPDGAWILTRSTGSNVKLWATQLPEKRRPIDEEPITLGGHGSFIRTAVFSPDGRFLLTNSNDGTARLWLADRRSRLPASKTGDAVGPEALRAETEEHVANAKKQLSRCLTIKQRIDFRIDPRPPDWCFASEKKYPFDDPMWTGWPNATPRNQQLAEDLGNYADKALFDGDHRTALQASKLGIRFDPEANWIRINLAHAYMYAGKTEDAKNEYLNKAYRGQQMPNGLWEDCIISDFELFRTNGRKEMPLMKEIENEFKKPISAKQASSPIP